MAVSFRSTRPVLSIHGSSEAIGALVLVPAEEAWQGTPYYKVFLFVAAVLLLLALLAHGMAQERVAQKGAGLRFLHRPGSCSPAVLNAKTAPLLLLICAMLYGGNVPLLKSLHVRGVPPLALLSLRFALASALSVPVVLWHWRTVAARMGSIAELSLYLSLGYVSQIFALERSTASATSIALSCTGVGVQLLEVLVDRKPASGLVMACSAVTIMGIVLFNACTEEPQLGQPGGGRAGTWEQPEEQASRDAAGKGLALLGTGLFSLHVWRSSKIMAASHESGRGGSFCSVIGFGQLPMTFLIISAVAASQAWRSPAEYALSASALGLAELLRICFCGLLCTALPTVLELSAFRLVQPAVSSLIYCTIPVFGVGYASALLNETHGYASCFASALVLGSSMLPSVLQIAFPCERGIVSKL